MTILSMFWEGLDWLLVFNNKKIFDFKLSTSEVKADIISIIYLSELSNIMYKIWNEVKFVSYLIAKLNAELNINFELSESSSVKFSISRTY